jgi:hypothetical protein
MNFGNLAKFSRNSQQIWQPFRLLSNSYCNTNQVIPLWIEYLFHNTYSNWNKQLLPCMQQYILGKRNNNEIPTIFENIFL